MSKIVSKTDERLALEQNCSSTVIMSISGPSFNFCYGRRAIQFSCKRETRLRLKIYIYIYAYMQSNVQDSVARRLINLN